MTTRDDLAILLKAKDDAHTIFSAAGNAARCGKDQDIPMAARIALDLDYHRSLLTSIKADNAYDDALKAFIAEETA